MVAHLPRPQYAGLFDYSLNYPPKYAPAATTGANFNEFFQQPIVKEPWFDVKIPYQLLIYLCSNIVYSERSFFINFSDLTSSILEVKPNLTVQ